jgi:hypothetical protein
VNERARGNELDETSNQRHAGLVTEGEATAAIRRLGAAGRFYILPHARKQAEGRGVTPRDIRHGLTNARAAAWQPDHGTWKVRTTDIDGDPLTLALAIEASVIVVTVF